jgi:hypothetical protein
MVQLYVSLLLGIIIVILNAENETYKTCKDIWRPEVLKGRCFGLILKTITSDGRPITTAAQCRFLCCQLGDGCLSWQFEKSKSECKVGGQMRLGLEVTGTPNWLVDKIKTHFHRQLVFSGVIHILM